jgi:hypothetical protein
MSTNDPMPPDNEPGEALHTLVQGLDAAELCELLEAMAYYAAAAGATERDLHTAVEEGLTKFEAHQAEEDESA